MNNIYFGIIIGLFLYFAGQRFFVVAVKAWNQRKEDEVKKKEENMRIMIDKVLKEVNKKK